MGEAREVWVADKLFEAGSRLDRDLVRLGVKPESFEERQKFVKRMRECGWRFIRLKPAVKDK